MVKIFKYKPQGVCSKEMEFEIDENDKIVSLRVVGGCNGNLKGIAALVKGRSIDEVINCLEGVECHTKGTSCPDQIAKALKMYKQDLANR